MTPHLSFTNTILISANESYIIAVFTKLSRCLLYAPLWTLVALVFMAAATVSLYYVSLSETSTTDLAAVAQISLLRYIQGLSSPAAFLPIPKMVHVILQMAGTNRSCNCFTGLLESYSQHDLKNLLACILVGLFRGNHHMQLFYTWNLIICGG